MAKKEQTASPQKKSRGMSLQGRVLFIFLIFACVVFRSTALLLLIGMLPTVIAFLTTDKNFQAKAYAIGIMNFAGCCPSILKLWRDSNDFEKVLEIMTDPITIIVMFASALGGYMLNWCCVSFVSALMYEKGKIRLKAIHKRQEELVERWGEEVTGNIPLDPDGFPIR